MEFSRKVKLYAHKHLILTGSLPKILTVSSHFNISESTVYRRLKEEDHSYNEIKRAIREAELKKIQNTELTTSSKSEYIGFTNSRSYYRFLSSNPITPDDE